MAVRKLGLSCVKFKDTGELSAQLIKALGEYKYLFKLLCTFDPVCIIENQEYFKTCVEKSLAFMS